jgi:FkbM family methyltransferase
MMLARVLGCYEVSKMAAVKRFVKPGGVFIDAGGNKGDFALLAAMLTGKEGKVVCFEPEPNNCDWIKQSIMLNGYQNVALQEVALSNYNGTAQLNIGRNSGEHTLLRNQRGRNFGAITVRTATLDSSLESLAVTTVNVMKVDVEGAEMSVLKGARGTLLANPQITLLIDIHPFLGVDPVEVCGFLSELGFCLYSMALPFNKPIENQTNLHELLAYRRFSGIDCVPVQHV